MTRRAQLAAAALGAALLAAGLVLWREQGIVVWLEQGLAYCF